MTETAQQKRKATLIANIKLKNPGITDEEAWEINLQRSRKSGSKGGKSPNAYRGFRDKPGLAKKAGMMSRKGKN